MPPLSPSGERRPTPLRVEARDPSPSPLAGRSSYAARLAAYRAGYGPKPEVADYLGLPGRNAPPVDDAMFYTPEENPFAWPPTKGSGAISLCVACALVSGSIVAGVALALFLMTRPAAAMVPSLHPRMPMEQDVVFGIVAFGILMVIIGGLALYGILRRDVKVSAQEKFFDPDQRHYQRPAHGPCFGEDDRYA